VSRLWKPIPGYEGKYEISDDGQVRSLARVVPTPKGSRLTQELLLTARPNRCGYLCVHLSRDGKTKNLTVHSLVAASFLGPRPEKAHVAHRDGNPANAKLGNLRYATPAENERDKEAHGTKFFPRGELNASAKLTPADVSAIKGMVASGRTQTSVALKFGVDPSMVSHILRGKHWKHLSQGGAL